MTKVRADTLDELIEKLEHLGAKVDYHDPHVPETHKMRDHDLKMRSVELTGEAVAGYDCVLISTNHKGVDYAMVAERARLGVDTRNAMRDVRIAPDRLVKA